MCVYLRRECDIRRGTPKTPWHYLTTQFDYKYWINVSKIIMTCVHKGTETLIKLFDGHRTLLTASLARVLCANCTNIFFGIVFGSFRLWIFYLSFAKGCLQIKTVLTWSELGSKLKTERKLLVGCKQGLESNFSPLFNAWLPIEVCEIKFMRIHVEDSFSPFRTR